MSEHTDALTIKDYLANVPGPFSGSKITTMGIDGPFVDKRMYQAGENVASGIVDGLGIINTEKVHAALLQDAESQRVGDARPYVDCIDDDPDAVVIDV